MADDELPDGWPTTDGARPDKGAHWRSSALAALPILALVVAGGALALNWGTVVGAVAATLHWLVFGTLETSPLMILWWAWLGGRVALWRHRRNHLTMRVVRLNVHGQPKEDGE